MQFGSVPIGGDAQQSLTLTSSGTAPLQISSLNATDADFSAQAPALPLTLAPGQTLSLPVKFGPVNAGVKTGKLMIASNAAATPSVAVNLKGSGAAQTPPPTSPTPALTISNTAVDFGSVTLGSQGATSVTLDLERHGGGGTAVDDGDRQCVFGGAAAAAAYARAGPAGRRFRSRLFRRPPAPSKARSRLQTMRQGSPNTISLTGAGVAPHVVASLSAPTSVEFGDVTVGSPGSKTITLVSNGTGPVTVKSITVAGAAFSDSPVPSPQVLQPNQQMSLTLKFNPSAARRCDRDGHGVQRPQRATRPLVVQMDGTGVVASTHLLFPRVRARLSFGQVLVGSQAQRR